MTVQLVTMNNETFIYCIDIQKLEKKVPGILFLITCTSKECSHGEVDFLQWLRVGLNASMKPCVPYEMAAIYCYGCRKDITSQGK